MKFFIGLLAFILISTLISAPGRAEEKTASESLQAFVTSALAHNPDLKSSQARWQKFTNRIAQVRSFDDPMLMLKIQNGVVSDPLNFSKEPMTGKVIGITQQIQFWGKRGIKEDVATKEAESYRWVVEERKVELTRMVKETWYQLYYIDKALGIVDKNIRILNDFITLAETKYSVSQGSQTDIMKAQVEHSKLLDMRITLEQQRRSAQANLNALLYRPTETPVGTIPDFEFMPLNLGDRDLQKIAYDNRPLIKSLSALISKGEAGRDLAKNEFYPDFNVSLEYMQRDPVKGGDGLDMYSIGLTFNLPVQRERRHAAVAESNSEVTLATEELNTLKNNINLGISDLLAQLERRKKLIELYKTGIIPQASQSLESATINYRVNKVDFLTLLDSQITLFNYEREYYDSLADYQIKLAQLEATVGTDPQSAPTVSSESHLQGVVPEQTMTSAQSPATFEQAHNY